LKRLDVETLMLIVNYSPMKPTWRSRLQSSPWKVDGH